MDKFVQEHASMGQLSCLIVFLGCHVGHIPHRDYFLRKYELSHAIMLVLLHDLFALDIYHKFVPPKCRISRP